MYHLLCKTREKIKFFLSQKTWSFFSLLALWVFSLEAKNPFYHAHSIGAGIQRIELDRKKILSPEATPILETTPSRFFAQKNVVFFFNRNCYKKPIRNIDIQENSPQIPLEEIQSCFFFHTEKKIKLFFL